MKNEVDKILETNRRLFGTRTIFLIALIFVIPLSIWGNRLPELVYIPVGLVVIATVLREVERCKGKKNRGTSAKPDKYALHGRRVTKRLSVKVADGWNWGDKPGVIVCSRAMCQVPNEWINLDENEANKHARFAITA